MPPIGPPRRVRAALRPVAAVLLAVGLAAPATVAAADVPTGTAAGALSAAPVPPPTSSTPTTDVDRLLVELAPRQRPQDARARVAELTGRPVGPGRTLGGRTATIALDAPVSAEEATALADRLTREDVVTSAMPDVHVTTATVPNDPFYDRQWNLSGRYGTGSAHGIGAETAWTTTRGADDVVVAVLDTGVLAHPDVADRLVPGYDLVDEDSDASDPGDWCDGRPSSWHGTHVAGIIGATAGNGAGIAGIDHRARIQPVRVLGRCGGSLSTIVSGIRWAAGLSVSGLPVNRTPADVINLSLGGYGACGGSLQSAIDAANAAGSLVVVAAGNEATDAAAVTPANCRDVLTVTATSRVGDRAFFANYGAVVDLAAPGGDTRYGNPRAAILSLGNTGTTVPDPTGMNYVWQQGTSMAAPHVAGVASLALATDPTLTPSQLRAVLRDTAAGFPTSSPSGTTYVCSSDASVRHHCGAGIVDAAAVVAALATDPDAPADAPMNTPAEDAGDPPADAPISGPAPIAPPPSAPPPTSPPPPAPTTPAPRWGVGDTLTFDLDRGDVRLSWPKATGTVTAYDVFRDGSRIASTTDRTARVTGLRVDQRYRLQVRARNATGSSAPLDRYVTPTGGFGDVPSGSPFHQDVAWLATSEVTRGCSADAFCPGAVVTRQQMAAFLTRGLGLTATSGVRFADVPRGSLFERDIDRLATAGITLGCGGDRFCPGEPVTRQQMAAFLTRGLGLTATSGVRFSDVRRPSNAATDIDRLATAGITLGCGGDRFCPADAVRRQQMAAFLRRGLTG